MNLDDFGFDEDEVSHPQPPPRYHSMLTALVDHDFGSRGIGEK